MLRGGSPSTSPRPGGRWTPAVLQWRNGLGAGRQLRGADRRRLRAGPSHWVEPRARSPHRRHPHLPHRGHGELRLCHAGSDHPGHPVADHPGADRGYRIRRRRRHSEESGGKRAGNRDCGEHLEHRRDWRGSGDGAVRDRHCPCIHELGFTLAAAACENKAGRRPRQKRRSGEEGWHFLQQSRQGGPLCGRAGSGGDRARAAAVGKRRRARRPGRTVDFRWAGRGSGSLRRGSPPAHGKRSGPRPFRERRCWRMPSRAICRCCASAGACS